MKKIILLVLFLAAAVPVGAQVTMWLQPTALVTNRSVEIGANQVMEVLSLALDPSSSIDVVMDNQKVTLGTGGNPNIPYPLVLSGPATVVLKKTSTGGQGSLMTFRIVNANETQTVLPILPFAVQK